MPAFPIMQLDQRVEKLRVVDTPDWAGVKRLRQRVSFQGSQ
jgi:hypothetical protein